MTTRRKFIKDVSINTAALAVGMGAGIQNLTYAKSQKSNGPYMATGIKIGEVSDTQAIIWTRLTKNPNRVSDLAPQPTFFYKNPDTGQFEPKSEVNGRPDREPKVVYPKGIDVNTIAGAVPGTDGEVRVSWKSGKNPWKQTSWQAVDPEHDFISQIKLTDLSPGTQYDVRVEARQPSSESLISIIDGNFRTAPSLDSKADITFMVVTCQDYHDRDDNSNGFKIYRSMLEQDPDFFVHTGDIVYYDQQAKNLDLARWHWHRMYSFPNLVEFHKRVGSYFEKDDHDTWMNDCWPGKQTKFMGDFTFKQGQQVFLDEVPMGNKNYRTYRWGKDLQIWLVEGRDFRSPNDMPDGPDKTIWGKEQIAWFKSTVDASDATFKILISPTPLVGPDRPKKNDNYANSGFHYESEMIRKFIEQHPNMYIVNGDRHWQYVSKDAETGLMEFGCGPASDEHAGGWDQNDWRPEHLYLNVIGGYLEVQIKHENDEPRIEFRHHHVDGKVLFEYKAALER